MDIIDLKIGSMLLIDNQIYTVTELHFSENSCIVTLENVETGQVIEKTIDTENDIELVTIETKDMQFSYEDNGMYYFMDIENYQQLPFTHDMVKDYMKYITEDSIVSITLVKDKLISIKPKDEIVLKVVSVENNKATLETGLVIDVPKNIVEGDRIKLSTINDKFISKIDN